MHYPENLAQLKEIITSARERKVGLVPRSSSGESIHGASVNEAAEIVSFEKMNKIMAVNRHDRYIRVQSGVTFAQLLPEV
ncbi:MAG: FAD-binding protein, partial [Oscillospiraceae bacterium]|nr:FAD-binding protein [Oscillospiraceae bacterium]